MVTAIKREIFFGIISLNSIPVKRDNNFAMVKQPQKLTIRERENIKYFFSLVMEHYFGDKKELMEMAGIDEDLLARFFDEKETK